MKCRIASLVFALASACALAEHKPEPSASGSPAAARSAPELLVAAAAAPAPSNASPLEVHFIDVGTGDFIWIKTGDDGVPGNGRYEGLNIIIDGKRLGPVRSSRWVQVRE